MKTINRFLKLGMFVFFLTTISCTSEEIDADNTNAKLENNDEVIFKSQDLRVGDVTYPMNLIRPIEQGYMRTLISIDGGKWESLPMKSADGSEIKVRNLNEHGVILSSSKIMKNVDLKFIFAEGSCAF